MYLAEASTIIPTQAQSSLWRLATDGAPENLTLCAWSFCKLASAPQKIVLSGKGSSVLSFTSGFTTLT
uniref:Uncharacterized protein n=1 Tax=Nelumbo nucifera TaxID=4432 RepID=A0A822Y328_NELNU|nr:TPA_asm: hypothetical protein HUJ06_026929 [Nelumbo nucifera]